jgi:hypothetical protein
MIFIKKIIKFNESIKMKLRVRFALEPILIKNLFKTAKTNSEAEMIFILEAIVKLK